MDPEQYHVGLADEANRLAAALAGADVAATPVPTCPGWSLAKLAKHVGIVHRWMEGLVAEGALTPRFTNEVRVAVPADPADLAQWLVAGVPPLVAALLAADPDREQWAWGFDQHTRWWARRAYFETLVHRVDAELAVGAEPEIAPAAAADGIDEYLANLRVAPWKGDDLRALGAAGGTLHLHADEGGEWMITLGPAGYDWEHGHGKADLALRGPAADLLLAVYGRRSPEVLEIFGDRALLDQWLEYGGL